MARLRKIGRKLIRCGRRLSTACCGGVTCPSYYLATRCVGVGCPGVPNKILVCTDAECGTGGPIGGKTIFVGGSCFVVDDSVTYGDPPHQPLPPGVPIFPDPVFSCEHECADPICQEPFGYFTVRECQCENTPGSFSAIIPCEVYWQHAGLRCPYGKVPVPSGEKCVVPLQFIPGPYPSGAFLIQELFEGGCCACCNGGCNNTTVPVFPPFGQTTCDCWKLAPPWVNPGAEQHCCCGSDIQNTAGGTLDIYAWDSVSQSYYLFQHVEYSGGWPGKILESFTYFDPAGNPVQSGANEYEQQYGVCDPESVRPFSSTSNVGDPCGEGLCSKTCETFTIVGTTAKPPSGGSYGVYNLTYTSNRGNYTQACDECGTENKPAQPRTPGDYL